MVGTQGAKGEEAIFNVHLSGPYGVFNPVKMELPVMLPALIKLIPGVLPW